MRESGSEFGKRMPWSAHSVYRLGNIMLTVISPTGPTVQNGLMNANETELIIHMRTAKDSCDTRTGLQRELRNRYFR